MKTLKFFLFFFSLLLIASCEPISIYRSSDSQKRPICTHRAACEPFRFEGTYPNVVEVEMLNEDGIEYSVEAVEGQVCVWFKEGVGYRKAKKVIESNYGKIVSQILDNGYYLVEVSADEMQTFLRIIAKDPAVDWACPNMVYYPCEVNTFILDNFNQDLFSSGDNIPHGDKVQFALQEYIKDISLKPYNIGDSNGQYMNIKKLFQNSRFCPVFGCTNSEFYAIKDISKRTGSGLIIINMSYGPRLPQKIVNGEKVGHYWINATDKERQEFRELYLLSLKETIKNMEPLKGKDFIVVKSAGNDGIKTFDKDIITYLRDNLSPKEKEVMDQHFLLVTAGETEKVHQDYSNEMESDRYDPWVTKTDISDFKYKGKKERGTSFAAPRTAGILSSVANEMNLTGTEVLKLAREITQRDSVITKEALQKAAEKKRDLSKEVTIEGVLNIYLLNNSGGGDITYYTDAEGNTIYAIEEDSSYPYCQMVNEYCDTDYDNTYLAFVIEADRSINVLPYLEAGDEELLDDTFQSSFMIVPQFQYNGKDFAEKYANKRVRAKGTLYVPGGGWRNATTVVVKLSSIELITLKIE